ncbi:hypothetical protein [Vibrio kanaloae]|uniref:hypothetical protein n=1 Tax=Vibrio kanaloae TaxID=170673 RepID=UPI0011B52099|nr:hypothetical protein [Vibrio kanaloae]
MNKILSSVTIDAGKEFLSLFIGAVIGTAITIYWAGDLITIAFVSLIASLIGGFLLFAFFGKYEWSKSILTSFISASFGAQLLSSSTTFLLYKIYSDLPPDDPKLKFFIDNSFYGSLGWNVLIIFSGYFGLLWLYQFARVKYYKVQIT